MLFLRTGQGFGGFGGHGPQGNYKASKPGAAAWGNPSSPFAPAFSPYAGYGGGFYGPPSFPAPITPTYGSTVQGSGEQQQQVYGQQPQYPPTFGQQPVQQGVLISLKPLLTQCKCLLFQQLLNRQQLQLQRDWKFVLVL